MKLEARWNVCVASFGSLLAHLDIRWKYLCSQVGVLPNSLHVHNLICHP